jgi:Xaa-Pro aminopeptidase
MLTPHPTLLIGPADWEPAHMPREEFTRRIDALWERDSQAEQAIVFGSPRHHAELAYFTNLTPKLEAAVALLSRTGAHRIFVGGGVNMIGAARPLTWIEQVLPMMDLADAIAAGGQRSLIVGADYMTVGFRRTVTEAIGAGEAADATAHVWSQMRRKSGHELAAIRHAHVAMTAGWMEMLEAFESGAGVTAIVAAGEQAANAAGAQDVRTLFSLDQGRTLRPVSTVVDQVLDPLLVYLAVRRFNYWTEDFLLFTDRRDPDPVRQQGVDALDAAIKLIKAGTPARDIEALIAGAIHPYRSHPLTARAFARRMGLGLEEPPYTDVGSTFEEDEVYSVRVGITDGRKRHHVISEMIRVREDGSELFGER